MLKSGILSRLQRMFKGSSSGKGRFGERKAAEYLEKSGYRIEKRNFSVRGGEADILATKDGLLHVIEVKTRSGRSFGIPEAAVTKRKASLALKAGRLYCRRHNISLSKLRGDVLAVELDHSGRVAEIRFHPNGLTIH